MMANIKSKNTTPEIVLRSKLHKRGFRYRLHQKHLPGTPDIVLPVHETAIFVNGWFWHYHEHCHFFKLPKTNSNFWRTKLNANRKRDQRNVKKLLNAGWFVGIVWECIFRNQSEQQIDEAISAVSDWIAMKKYKRRVREFRKKTASQVPVSRVWQINDKVNLVDLQSRQLEHR